jgi:hypothetical protein
MAPMHQMVMVAGSGADSIPDTVTELMLNKK